jgi:hypothetical protein
MIYVRFVTLVLVLGSLALGASPILSESEIPELQDRGLQVHYWLDKKTYLPGEQIFVGQELTNKSGQLTYYRVEDLQHVSILDQNGAALPVTMPWGLVEYFGREFIPGKGNNVWHPIPPDATRARSFIPILDRFGKGSPMTGLSYLEPGVYAITDGVIASDTVTFKVVPPQDSADVSAWRDFLQAAEQQSVDKGWRG